MELWPLLGEVTAQQNQTYPKEDCDHPVGEVTPEEGPLSIPCRRATPARSSTWPSECHAVENDRVGRDLDQMYFDNSEWEAVYLKNSGRKTITMAFSRFVDDVCQGFRHWRNKHKKCLLYQKGRSFVKSLLHGTRCKSPKS